MLYQLSYWSVFRNRERPHGRSLRCTAPTGNYRPRRRGARPKPGRQEAAGKLNPAAPEQKSERSLFQCSNRLGVGLCAPIPTLDGTASGRFDHTKPRVSTSFLEEFGEIRPSWRVLASLRAFANKAGPNPFWIARSRFARAHALAGQPDSNRIALYINHLGGFSGRPLPHRPPPIARMRRVVSRHPVKCSYLLHEPPLRGGTCSRGDSESLRLAATAFPDSAIERKTPAMHADEQRLTRKPILTRLVRRTWGSPGLSNLRRSAKSAVQPAVPRYLRLLASPGVLSRRKPFAARRGLCSGPPGRACDAALTRAKPRRRQADKRKVYTLRPEP